MVINNLENSIINSINQKPKLIQVSDMRLQRLILNGFDLASLSDYSKRSEIDVAEVISQLEPYLDGVTLDLETANGGVYLLTAPAGRHIIGSESLPPPNLWEELRRAGDPSFASLLLSVIREIEFGGWVVKPARDSFAFLSILYNNKLVPLLLTDDASRLTKAGSLLDTALSNGDTAVVVLSNPGGLDLLHSEVRRWFSLRPGVDLEVVVLEKPRYTPTIFSPNDRSVSPESNSIRPSSAL